MSDHGLYASPNNFEPYTDREVRLTKAIEAVLAQCDYLDTLADGDRHYAAGFRKLVTDALTP